jgi:hypothetical protein
VSLLSDDELMGELYKRLGEIGWSADAAPTLLGIVSDSKTFLHEPSNSVLKFLAQGEAAGVRLTVGGQPAFACDHASPQRINALLDVLGLLPTTDEWMAWYRDGLWASLEDGSIPPS